MKTAIDYIGNIYTIFCELTGLVLLNIHDDIDVDVTSHWKVFKNQKKNKILHYNFWYNIIIILKIIL